MLDAAGPVREEGIGDCALVKMDIEGAEAVVLESAGPFLAERRIPLLVAMHEEWWPRRLDPAWLAGYGTVEGHLGSWGQVLCT